MPFEIFVPAIRARCAKAGFALLNSVGVMTLCMSDLHRHQIRDEAVVLYDKGTRRIAIRAARAGEPSLKVRTNKSKTSGAIGVRTPCSTLGVDLTKSKGALKLIEKDDLLIVQF